MRKLSSILSVVVLGLVLMLSLASCGDEYTDDGGKIIFEAEPVEVTYTINEGTPYETKVERTFGYPAGYYIYEIQNGEKYYYTFSKDELSGKIGDFDKKQKEPTALGVTKLVQYDTYFEVEIKGIHWYLLSDENNQFIKYNGELMQAYQYIDVTRKFNNAEVYYEEFH